MIEDLVPDHVASAESADSPLGGQGPVQGGKGERAALRQRESAAVRTLARRGLRTLGLPDTDIPRGPQGAPVWPAGAVGSLTHCPGYRAAVVARSDQVRALGLDAEPARPLPSGVLDLISDAAERRHLRLLRQRRADVCWERLLFCAKEAVYKAWFPLTQRWLDFTEACVEFEMSGTWHARLQTPAPASDGMRIEGFAGRWACRAGLVLAAAIDDRPAGKGRS